MSDPLSALTASPAEPATFIFADIAGFTALTEAHGDQQAAELVAEFCGAVRAELPASGGSQVKSIGDALMLRTPDPAAAIRLGLRIANGIMRDHGAPAVRVGLHHGPALERDGDYFGATVNLAARVSSQAVGGEVLLTANTAALAGELRELSDQAHGANSDLGNALVHNLAVVDPADMDVARAFVYALLGADHDSSPYTQTGERIARIAAGGIRLVIEELRTDVTKTRKDGSRGRVRYDYGDHRDPHAAIAWLWRFLDGAKTAGELYGRALVVLAAEQHASRLVVPTSQRMPATRWSSHKDIAAKALRKLAGPHVPAALTGLERAVKRAHADYDKAESAAREQQRTERQSVEPEAGHGIGDELDEDVDEAS